MSTPEARLRKLNITLPVPPTPGREVQADGAHAATCSMSPGMGRRKSRAKRWCSASSAQRHHRAGQGVGPVGRHQHPGHGSAPLSGRSTRVKRLVKTLGMVNSAHGFSSSSQWVINGFSELMAEIFGEDAGVGSRSAVGMGALPGDIPVEVECMFEV